MSWTAAGDGSSWVSSKVKDKTEKHKLKPQSVPTSPAASGRGESSLSPLDSALQSLKMKKPSTSKSSSPPGTPVSKDHRDSFRDSFKKTLFRSSSDKRKPTTSTASDIELAHGHLGEHADNPASRVVRQFKSAHESFRLRMFQEQHGFEPVFMTKKRTRDNKSVMSEFKGGDLNKYTAKTYAIQNGNEVFGGK
ncbi:SAP30_Sin3_bdg domain-containing protein [Caenorhabditis elegans]|uniref:SAP30_Sin3_bdg domain-containing protein n=1 Tax=Caenorhabditis elegans TaxID=6239 RepID=C6KRG2_CAEEL|nr:SAP30_Sin3_bdg domain-containing protein [Caenorhabditis elegans]CCD67042.2 SAP30_Sin3_bdg domain-containing protein [Caenorhabditis elegans]